MNKRAQNAILGNHWQGMTKATASTNSLQSLRGAEISASMQTRNQTNDGSRTPAYLRVAELLTSAIRAQRLRAGALIKIADVAAVLGLSRSPVRQAFGILSSQGLVRSHEGQGFIVGQADTAKRIVLTPRMLGLIAPHPAEGSGPADGLYYALEKELVLRSIHSGERVNELGLSRRFKIGRNVARELILRAQHAGIVTRNGNRSWRLVPFDEKRCADLYDLRSLLEPEALRQAIPNLPPALLERMHARLLSAAAAPDKVTAAEFDLFENDLHRELLTHCSNREILEALTRTMPSYICGKYLKFRQLSDHSARDDESVCEVVAEHLTIVDAILAGNTDQAVEALRAHLHRGRTEAVASLREISTPAGAEYAKSDI